MNIALFAADIVGLEVARHFARNNAPLACLVVHTGNHRGLNEQILDALSPLVSHILSSDVLYEDTTLKLLQDLELDLGILAWWPTIIKWSVTERFRLGLLNFHPSNLPYNRGKDPNFWAIVEGAPFGVTLHFIDAGVDTGDIAFQQRIPITWEDTGETLYRKAQQAIVELFKANFDRILSGDIPRQPQDQKTGSFHRRKELDSSSHIDLDASYRARDLLNLIRARTFPPHPAAWFVDNGQGYKVRISINRVENSDDEE